jgi:uncharacterized membrane protein YoaT (DUF817 family)
MVIKNKFLTYLIEQLTVWPFLFFSVLLGCCINFFCLHFIADLRASVNSLEKEICCLKIKRDEMVNRMDEKRY